MTFPRKYLLLVTSLMIGVICIGLYLFLVRPVIVKRQEAVKETEKMITKLRRYIKDPPSPEKVTRLNREKELLEGQYEDVVRELDFLSKRSLPEKTGLLHLYFEEQLERAEDDLDRLGKKTGIEVPARLGFKMEKPQSKEELAILLSHVATVKELVTIAIGAGVNQISSINPIPLTEEDRFVNVSGKPLLEELDLELSLRAEVSTLTRLLYQLTTCSHFFTVKEVQLKSVSPSPRRETTSSRGEPRRRGRRARRREEIKELVDTAEVKESTRKAVERELEVKILVSTRLLVGES